jgi:hypothetical protein
MKANNAAILAITLGILLVGCLSFLGVSMVTTNVFGVNQTNDSTLAKVYVWNTEPSLYAVSISPNPIDLTPGNTTNVTCVASVFDYNGWGDVIARNATFYHYDYAIGTDSDDKNNHYTSTNCSCVRMGTSLTNATCNCTIPVWYYAYNGTWICNMTVSDIGGNATPGRRINFTSVNWSNVSLNAMMAIDSPAVIDYGNLSVTETSNLTTANITNWGNVLINVSVRAYGGTNETRNDSGNYSMFCDYGKIDREFQRFSINSSSNYSDMWILTNISTVIQDYRLQIRTNDNFPTNDRNQTYWMLRVPLSVGGSCNGTIEFQATDLT